MSDKLLSKASMALPTEPAPPKARRVLDDDDEEEDEQPEKPIITRRGKINYAETMELKVA
jgi:hypothetical protein